MPTTFKIADQTTTDLVYQVMQKFHKHLCNVQLELNILVAFGAKNQDGEQVKPALKVGGYPALATIKVNKLADRVAGMKDATLTLDGDAWGEHSEERKEAIIDHELEHLELKQDRKGIVMTDDVGRPLLKLKLHDFHFEGFQAVADRHKQESVEVQSIAHVGNMAVRQGWLPGF